MLTSMTHEYPELLRGRLPEGSRIGYEPRYDALWKAFECLSTLDSVMCWCLIAIYTPHAVKWPNTIYTLMKSLETVLSEQQSTSADAVEPIECCHSFTLTWTSLKIPSDISAQPIPANVSTRRWRNQSIKSSTNTKQRPQLKKHQYKHKLKTVSASLVRVQRQRCVNQ